MQPLCRVQDTYHDKNDVTAITSGRTNIKLLTTHGMGFWHENDIRYGNTSIGSSLSDMGMWKKLHFTLFLYDVITISIAAQLNGRAI